jgi:Ca2+-binding EF-hand superfamily protein
MVVFNTIYPQQQGKISTAKVQKYVTNINQSPSRGFWGKLQSQPQR